MDRQEREIIDRISSLRPRPERAQLMMLWWGIEHLRPEIEGLLVTFFGQKKIPSLLADLSRYPALRKFMVARCREDGNSPMAVLATRLRAVQVAY